MGSGIEIQCTNCGNVQFLRLGVGMGYSSLHQVIDLIHYSKRAKVVELLMRPDLEVEDYSHKAFVCSKCHTIYERFDFEIRYGGEKKYRSTFNCLRCRKPLIELDVQGSLPPCAECGALSLQVHEALHWD